MSRVTRNYKVFWTHVEFHHRVFRLEAGWTVVPAVSPHQALSIANAYVTKTYADVLPKGESIWLANTEVWITEEPADPQVLIALMDLATKPKPKTSKVKAVAPTRRAVKRAEQTSLLNTAAFFIPPD